jgi:hypothetical protein
MKQKTPKPVESNLLTTVFADKKHHTPINLTILPGLPVRN